MANDKTQCGYGGRRYMAAVLLGTAISTLSVPVAKAQDANQISHKAIGDVSRYCTACWRNARLPADSWNDCTQEVLSRLLQRLSPGGWNLVFKPEHEERQEFLRAIDAVKKRIQRRLKKSRYLNGTVADVRDHHQQTRNDEREMVHHAAEQLLTDRQQQILRLSFEGWGVQDIADEMSLAPERVSDEKYKAVRKLREYLKNEVD